MDTRSEKGRLGGGKLELKLEREPEELGFA